MCKVRETSDFQHHPPMRCLLLNYLSFLLIWNVAFTLRFIWMFSSIDLSVWRLRGDRRFFFLLTHWSGLWQPKQWRETAAPFLLDTRQRRSAVPWCRPICFSEWSITNFYQLRPQFFLFFFFPLAAEVVGWWRKLVKATFLAPENWIVIIGTFISLALFPSFSRVWEHIEHKTAYRAHGVNGWVPLRSEPTGRQSGRPRPFAEREGWTSGKHVHAVACT